MPSTPLRSPRGLEVWLMGTVGELQAARHALAAVFIPVESVREPLPGGRYRQYLRMTARTVTSGDTSSQQEPDQCRETLFP